MVGRLTTTALLSGFLPISLNVSSARRTGSSAVSYPPHVSEKPIGKIPYCGLTESDEEKCLPHVLRGCLRSKTLPVTENLTPDGSVTTDKRSICQHLSLM